MLHSFKKYNAIRGLAQESPKKRFENTQTNKHKDIKHSEQQAKMSNGHYLSEYQSKSQLLKSHSSYLIRLAPFCFLPF